MNTIIKWSTGFVFLFACSTGVGQYAVQQGNILDANNRVGSGGLNTRTDRTYTNSQANRFITGNTRSGTAFRGFSPIRDSSSFFMGNESLPSTRLSNFRRDSFGVDDARRGYTGSTLSRQPFYERSSTVADVGLIRRGLNQAGTSQISSSFVIPRSEYQVSQPSLIDDQNLSPLSSSSRVSSLIVRSESAMTGFDPRVNNRLLRSPLFGGFRAIPADQLARETQSARGVGQPVMEPLDLRLGTDRPGEPLDLRQDGRVDLRQRLGETDSPLDRILGTDRQSERRAGGEDSPGPLAEPLTSRTRLLGASAEDRVEGDVFSRMQSQLIRPIDQPADADGEQPESTRLAVPTESEQTARAAQPGADEGREVTMEERIVNPLAGSSEPIRTFVGTEDSVLNQWLARGEELLADGEYYRAADAYRMARAVDFENPLPLLGSTMALLAAGDYLSSANTLFQAIRLFDSLALFRIDLTAFVPDLAALDRRRADLEQRLSRFDDFRLRFLLGYAEYCSGLEEFGLRNMQRASENMPEHLDHVKEFVQVLQRRHSVADRPVEVEPGQ